MIQKRGIEASRKVKNSLLSINKLDLFPKLKKIKTKIITHPVQNKLKHYKKTDQ